MLILMGKKIYIILHSKHFVYLHVNLWYVDHMGQHTRFWYLLHQRAAKDQISLRQSLRFSHAQSREVEEDSDQKLDL